MFRRIRRIAAVIVCLAVIPVLLAGSRAAEEKKVYKTVSDLEGCRVGIVTGTTFDTLAMQTWGNCELVYVNSNTDVIPALESSKIDCFISDKPWIAYLASANKNITYIDEVLLTENYGLIFAKSDDGAALRDDFNAFLREQGEDDGFLSGIEQIWFNVDDNTHPSIDPASLPAKNGTIRVCTEAANPPFEYYENGQIVGYNIHLLYLYCEARGYGLTIDDMKFDSLIAAVTSGKYDIASSSFSITPERAESVNFSDVIYESGPVVVIRTENSVNAQVNDEDPSFFTRIAQSFEKTFIREERWKLFADGIAVTLFIAVLSLVAGTALGFALYMWYRKGGRFAGVITGWFSWFITGMPEVLLLLILFYIVFGSTAITGTWVSVIAFAMIVGVNVFGMMKSGVTAVDRGQMEAAIALGYSENKAFFRIILPQALEFILPGYHGSIVSLIKSTAIVGYLAVQDLTKASDIVRSRTYEAFFPLIVTAVIYFVLAWLLVRLVTFLQKWLLPIRKNRKNILKGIQTGKEAEKE